MSTPSRASQRQRVVDPAAREREPRVRARAPDLRPALGEEALDPAAVGLVAEVPEEQHAVLVAGTVDGEELVVDAVGREHRPPAERGAPRRRPPRRRTARGRRAGSRGARPRAARRRGCAPAARRGPARRCGGAARRRRVEVVQAEDGGNPGRRRGSTRSACARTGRARRRRRARRSGRARPCRSGLGRRCACWRARSSSAGLGLGHDLDGPAAVAQALGGVLVAGVRGEDARVQAGALHRLEQPERALLPAGDRRLGQQRRDHDGRDGVAQAAHAANMAAVRILFCASEAPRAPLNGSRLVLAAAVRAARRARTR